MLVKLLVQLLVQLLVHAWFMLVQLRGPVE